MGERGKVCSLDLGPKSWLCPLGPSSRGHVAAWQCPEERRGGAGPGEAEGGEGQGEQNSTHHQDPQHRRRMLASLRIRSAWPPGPRADTVQVGGGRGVPTGGEQVSSSMMTLP